MISQRVNAIMKFEYYDQEVCRMTDVYSIGEILIDFMPGSEPDSYIRKAGGAPANAAIAVAKNGLKASMCCKAGDDEFGRFLMKTLREYQVTPACPKLTRDAVTTMAFVTLGEDGERVFTFARKPGADMFLSEEEVREEDIENSVIIHGGSFSLSAEPAASATVRALRLGCEKEKLVSFDVNYRDMVWDQDVEACTRAVMGVLPYVDLLKISDEEADMMGGEAALPDLMEKYHITAIIETLGGSGAQALFQGEKICVPGHKVHAVDTTGAGDAFWGGFLSHLRFQGVEHKSDLTASVLREAMEYGNVSGCICVQGKGAIASIPTREQIERYRKENNI